MLIVGSTIELGAMVPPEVEPPPVMGCDPAPPAGAGPAGCAAGAGAGVGLKPDGPGGGASPLALPAAAKRVPVAADELDGESKLTFEIAPWVAAGAVAEGPPLLPPKTTSWPCARAAGFQLAPKTAEGGLGLLALSWDSSVSQLPELAVAAGLIVAGIAAEPENPAAGTIRSGSTGCPAKSG